MSYSIRVNGRGNAWPLELGVTPNPRFSSLHKCCNEYANTSYSILASGKEILFDIGQGVVPFLVQNGNKLPDAVILSHSHFDHISGLDWLVASYKRNCLDKKQKEEPKLPIYASKPCFDDVLRRFGYLQNNLEFRELKYGTPQVMTEAPQITLTAFPVFHGDFAPGAILVLAEFKLEEGASSEKAIFTGDLLCPLLRENDYERLQDAKVIYADSNTRFPWPKSSHWSIAEDAPKDSRNPYPFTKWSQQDCPSYLVTPHARGFDLDTHLFLDQFLCEALPGKIKICWSILEFARLVQPGNIQVVHYSGHEDQEYHQQAILTDDELLKWTQDAAASANLSSSISWKVPKPGDIFTI